MRIVRDDDGRFSVLVDATGSTCRARSLHDGTERTVPSDELTVVEPADALDVLGIDADERDSLRKMARTDRAIGLLVELNTAGPLSVRTILDRFDICESDLHGLVTELRAAGFLEPATVYGERGYRTTDRATDLLATPEQ